MIFVRTVTAFGLAVVPLAVATAQDKYSSTPVFTFTTEAVLERTANASELKGSTDLKPRPNNSSVVFLYAKNPKAVESSFIVEMKSELNGAVLGRATLDKVPANTWARVRFAKPAAPPAPAAPAPAPATPAAPAPAEPPPPGIPVARGTDGFPITFRLLDATGNEELDAAKKPYGLPAKVVFADPVDYLTIDKPTATSTAGVNDLSQKVTSKGPPPTALRLSFATPDGGTPPVRGEGVYSRTLTPTETDKTPSVTLTGRVISNEAKVTAHLAVDGVERVKVYDFSPSATTGQVNESTNTAARIYPITAPPGGVIRPGVFPVRVEVDNPAKTAQLEIHVRRSLDTGSGDGKSEVIRLGGPRNEKLFVDAAEPNGQGIGFTTKSSDWTVPVNLTDVRGKVSIAAVLREGTTEKSGSYPLVVDAYPPKDVAVRVVGLKDNKQLVKGKPLQVRASATDAESKVVKAVFFLGRLPEDGKLPADAVVVDAPELDAKGKPTGAWVGAIPIAPDKRGEVLVNVVMIDQAGNASDPKLTTGGSIKIELVDPPPPIPPTGKIDGIVMIGERPQPGVTVNVEGGIKISTVTNASGKFCVQGLLPGNYKVSAAKTDVTTGVSGVQEVGVLPEKKTQVILELKKNK